MTINSHGQSADHNCCECSSVCDCDMPEGVEYGCCRCSTCWQWQDEQEKNDPIFLEMLRQAFNNKGTVKVFGDPTGK